MRGALFEGIDRQWEKLQPVDLQEYNLTIHREILNNGVRLTRLEVIPIDQLKPPQTETIVLRETDLPTISVCMERLQNSLSTADGQVTDEVKQAVVQLGQCLSAQIRGVCVIEGSPPEQSDDGMIYLSKAALTSGDITLIQQEATAVFRQLQSCSELEREDFV